MNQYEHEFTKIVYCFLKNLQTAFRQIDEEIDIKTKHEISGHLSGMLFNHIATEAFTQVLLPSLTSVTFNIYSKLRLFFKKTLMSFKEKFEIGHFPFEKIYRKLRRMDPLANQCVYRGFIDIMMRASDDALKEVARKVVEHHYIQMQTLKKEAERISDSEKKECALVSSLFGTTWIPAFQALGEKGWNLNVVLHDDVKNSDSYGICTTDEIPAKNVIFSKLLGDLVFMINVKNHPILLNGETYFGANWDANRALVLYLLSGAITKTIKDCRQHDSKNLIYIMYDALKPVIKNAAKVKKDLSKFYHFHMSMADRIIFNSNDKSFGDFFENSYGIKCPRLHFVRYSEPPIREKKRLNFGSNNDEFHMVCITACLDEEMDAARSSTPAVVRSIVEQGIHFHYYSRDPKYLIDQFVQSLTNEAKKHFHVYPVNRNQRELVGELHQYHVGINPSDYIVFSQVHSYLNDRQYQDGMHRYFQATYPTSALTYAAAGLPVILPSSLYDCRQFLQDTSLMLEVSEVDNMLEFFKKIDIKAYCERAEKTRERAWINTHIDVLDKFIGEVSSPTVELRVA